MQIHIFTGKLKEMMRLKWKLGSPPVYCIEYLEVSLTSRKTVHLF